MPEPHAKQRRFIQSKHKRKIVQAGRRGGKTVGLAILATREFLRGRRVLYATPTAEQIDRFWSTVTQILHGPITMGFLYKNETRHIIEVPYTESRIRAKTAWNADTLRGDYADVLILDEWQLMNEDAWEIVGAPMLLDNNGDAVFAFTPPSFRMASVSKAHDRLHANKMFKRALSDQTGRWLAVRFTSHDNPHISQEALADIVRDMSPLAYRQEILAEAVDEVPGALWKREQIEACRVESHPPLERLIIAVDPATTSNSDSDSTGIIVAGRDENGVAYILHDLTIRGAPAEWGRVVVNAFHLNKADLVIIEDNQGGEMTEYTLRTIDPDVPVRRVHARRGKFLRADPVSVLYTQGRVKHVGFLPELEDQMCTWIPGDASPDRLDAMVHGVTHLCIKSGWLLA